MVRLVFDLQAPEGSVTGVKEHLAMYLERFGDLRLVSAEEIISQQMKITEGQNIVPENHNNMHRSPRG